MIPYRNSVVDGRTVREKWERGIANAAYQQIVAEEKAKAKEADRAMALRERGIIDWDGATSYYDARSKSYVVDPILSEKRHSPAAVTDAYRDRWWEFCSKPQDPGLWESAMPSPYTKKDRPAGHWGELSNDEDDDAAEDAVEAPKRKRGRPRKDQLQEV